MIKNNMVILSMIGVDIGSSFTKVCIFYCEKEYFDVFRTSEENINNFFNNNDRIKLIANQALSRNDLEKFKICITGSGSHKFKEILSKIDPKPLFCDEIPTSIQGVLHCLKDPSRYITVGGKGYKLDDKFIVASLGTGAAFMYYEIDKTSNKTTSEHIAGTGMAGGTFLGLSKLIFNLNDFHTLYDMAMKGKAENVDLMISDLVGADYISKLTAEVVASSMAKAAYSDERPDDNDIAASIIKTISMSIGCNLAAVCHGKNCKHCILIGGFLDSDGIITNSIVRSLNLFEPDVTLIIPTNSQFVCSIGAAVNSLDN